MGHYDRPAGGMPLVTAALPVAWVVGIEPAANKVNSCSHHLQHSDRRN